MKVSDGPAMGIATVLWGLVPLRAVWAYRGR